MVEVKIDLNWFLQIAPGQNILSNDCYFEYFFCPLSFRCCKEYLMHFRFKENGGKIEQRSLESLSEVSETFKKII